MTAKLRIPATPPWAIPRPRLFDKLTQGTEGPLTLVTSPAGSGKTLLVGSWTAARAARPVAWVTLDAQDTKPGLLWSYVLASLGQVGVPVAQVGLPTCPDATEQPLLTRLAACLSDLPHPVVLVLDNADVLTGSEATVGIDFLLRHAAPQLRVVLVGRYEPPLPLHRYRVAGSLAELRFQDLAFTPPETTALLAAHDVHLPESSAVTLGWRTRGWAAGVRLTALALQHRTDSPAAAPAGPATDEGGFVPDDGGFVTDEGDIADYFFAEVLDAQSPDVRDVLLRTSVVDRMWPGLAIELSDRTDAARTLATLAHTDTFVTEVSAERGVYEYHPLVRDLLRTRLRREAPNEVGHLHRKAARWLADAGRVTDAVIHACAAADWDQAARLAVGALSVGRLIGGSTSDPLFRSLAPLPQGTTTPEAASVHAVLALRRNDLDACAKHLLRATELVAERTAEDSTALRLTIAVTQLTRARVHGDATTALPAAATAEALLAELADRGAPVHGDVSTLVQLGKGGVLLYTGDVKGATAALNTGLATATRGDGCERLRLECLGQLAMVEAVQGRLRRAAEYAQKVCVPGYRRPVPTGQQPPSADVALAWVRIEEFDPAGARRHAERAAGCAGLRRDPVASALLTIVQARIRRARGDVGGAVAAIERAHRAALAGTAPSWLVGRLAAMRAATRAISGTPEPPAAASCDDGVPPSPGQAVTRAVASLAAGAAAQAHGQVSPVLTEQGVPLDVQVEAWLLVATCELVQGRPEPARTALDRALRLAAPERLRRPVFEAAPRLRQFLRQSAELAEQHRWLGSDADEPRDDGWHRYRATVAGQDTGPVVETLTEKEAEVLRHLADMLTTEEIARAMFVSVNTVKTHIRGVLRKLAASRRNEAVRRARELGLV